MIGRARLPEKLVQWQVVNLLRSIGAAVYILGTRRPSGDFQGTRQTPGIGDVYCILPPPRVTPGPGCALWVEVKADGGRLSPEQREFQALCAGANIPHVVGGVDQVIAFLIQGGWLKGESVPHYRTEKRGLSGCI